MCETGAGEPHVPSAIGYAPSWCRVRFDGAAGRNDRLDVVASRSVMTTRDRIAGVGLEGHQRRESPSLQLEAVTSRRRLGHSAIHVRQARRRRRPRGPSGAFPCVLHAGDRRRIERHRDADIGWASIGVTATELEAWSREKDAPRGEVATCTVQHHVERPRANEGDRPAVCHFLLRIDVNLVRRVVEAIDREVWRRVKLLVPVQRVAPAMARSEVAGTAGPGRNILGVVREAAPIRKQDDHEPIVATPPYPAFTQFIGLRSTTCTMLVR